MDTTRERMTRREAAAYLGISEQTLANWASSGRYSLPFIKLGSRVLYDRAALDRFMAERTATHTGELTTA